MSDLDRAFPLISGEKIVGAPTGSVEEGPKNFIDLLMGLFRGAVFRHGGGARKQRIKQPLELPTSTMALMGRFPSLMGRFPTLMGRFPDFVPWAVLSLEIGKFCMGLVQPFRRRREKRRKTEKKKSEEKRRKAKKCVKQGENHSDPIYTNPINKNLPMKIHWKTQPFLKKKGAALRGSSELQTEIFPVHTVESPVRFKCGLGVERLERFRLSVHGGSSVKRDFRCFSTVPLTKGLVHGLVPGKWLRRFRFCFRFREERFRRFRFPVQVRFLSHPVHSGVCIFPRRSLGTLIRRAHFLPRLALA